MAYSALRQVFEIMVTMHSSPEPRAEKGAAASNTQLSAGAGPFVCKIETTWAMQILDQSLEGLDELSPPDAPSTSGGGNAGSMLPPLTVNTRVARTTEHGQSRYCKIGNCCKLQQVRARPLPVCSSSHLLSHLLFARHSFSAAAARPHRLRR